MTNRRLRLAAAYLRGRPIWCSWQLTRRCGSLCLFCEHRLEASEVELDARECARVAERLADWGALVVSLTGGEPFLRSDLPEVVTAIARHHYPLLTTHGWLVTPEKAEAVWRAGLECATVRLHGTEAARHDTAAGLPGSFERAFGALHVFAGTRTSPRQRINVKLQLDGDDVAGLDGLLDRASALGSTVTVEPVFPVGRGRAAGLASSLLALKERHRNLRSSRAYLARFDDARADGVGGCRGARAFVNVDHRGRVTKCVEFQAPEDRAGDLTREDVQAIGPRLRDIEAGNACRSCWSASRGEIESLFTARGLLQALPDLVRS